MALYDSIGLDNLSLNLRGQLNRNRLFFPQFKLNLHPILQKCARIAEQIGRQHDLLVIHLIHEDEHFAILIEELIISRVEPNLFDRISAAETNIGFAAILQVLHLNLHVSSAFARLSVLDLGDLPNALFIFDDVARTNVHAADFHVERAFDVSCAASKACNKCLC